MNEGLSQNFQLEFANDRLGIELQTFTFCPSQ